MTSSHSQPQNKEKYLVIGGSGFLGSHVVAALLAQGETHVSVYDLHLPIASDVQEGVVYHQGNILDEQALLDALKKDEITTVFHTVSPVHAMKREVHHSVNIEGTKRVVSACVKAGSVTSIVYTSTTGVVWTGKPVRGATEDEIPLVTKEWDTYGYTKAIAEKIIIDANGQNGMRTVALRPCGMVGERDQQAMWRIAEAIKHGQWKYSIGPCDHLFGMTYVGNIADAHLLAADKISTHASSEDRDAIAGQAFFVGDSEPVVYHVYIRTLWKLMGADVTKIVVLPLFLAWTVSAFSEGYTKITGRVTAFDMYLYRLLTTEQWYSGEKAKRLLGYSPRVSLEEGCKRSVDWWNEKGAKEYADKKKSKRNRAGRKDS